MSRRTRIAGDPVDAGFTLVELLIYSALLLVLLSVVGGMLISASSAQTGVNQINKASNEAQLAANNIEQGIRNASGFKITVPTGGQLLQARVAGVTQTGATTAPTTSTTWQCQAWYYSKSTGQIFTKTSSTGLLAAPTAPASNGWTALVAGVPSTVSTPFALVSGSSTQLALNFSVTAQGTSTVQVATVVSTRSQTDTTTAPATCY